MPSTETKSGLKQDEDKDATRSNKNETKNTEQSTTKSGHNIALLCVLMLGIGCISGYFLFVSLHTSRCTELMDVEEEKYSKSQEELKAQYLQTMQEHQSCLTELSDSDGNKHGIRFEKHQALMDRHEDTVDRLLKLQSEHSETSIQFQKLRTELERSQETVVKLQNDKRKCMKSKELMKQLVTECKTNEL